MKKIITTLLFTFSFYSPCDNIIVNGTRFIYEENDNEITIQLNNLADRPAIAQTWLDIGDSNAAPESIKTPFQVTPPISRLNAKGGQVIRIKLVDNTSLPKDKESLFWLNILDIPPLTKNNSDNVLQLAIRSRFKLFYRPVGLTDRNTAQEKIIAKKVMNKLILMNPTPYYITIKSIISEKGDILLDSGVMLLPNSNESIEIGDKFISGKIIINNINDYGASIATKLTLQ